MIIGVPKEVKVQEYRIGMVPGGVKSLIRAGHRVLLEKAAGEGSGYHDGEYEAAGAKMVTSASEVYERADMIVKVKEPQPSEYKMLKHGQILFCYLHLAPEPELTQALIDQGVNAIALETIQLDDGTLPCLSPMSEIAGRMAVQIGAHYLEKKNGGAGVLLGGVPGVTPALVTIIGAGQVGSNAARIAVGMNARVVIFDIDLQKLAHLDELYAGRLITSMSDPDQIERFVPYSHLLVGGVLHPGGRAPVLVTEEMVKEMRKGSVIVDVAVDQGGCIETIHPTTHENPTYILHDVIHYGVSNMPGAVPRTSTQALTNATLRYIQMITDKGLEHALENYPPLARGLNIYCPSKESKGCITCEPVAQALGLEYSAYSSLVHNI
ncbi:MAG: alanine dehydrogenase [Deltaproteobacteria bacterium]|nr:alanine dehydrogenase [Deltaproteobacteria bacterium]